MFQLLSIALRLLEDYCSETRRKTRRVQAPSMALENQKMRAMLGMLCGTLTSKNIERAGLDGLCLCFADRTKGWGAVSLAAVRIDPLLVLQGQRKAYG